jgi:hypothetical protein
VASQPVHEDRAEEGVLVGARLQITTWHTYHIPFSNKHNKHSHEATPSANVVESKTHNRITKTFKLFICYAVMLCNQVQSNPAQHNAYPGAEVGALHHTTTALARVQLRHADAHALPVDGDEGLGQPLVPDLAVVCLAPHGDGDVGVCGEGEGSL